MPAKILIGPYGFCFGVERAVDNVIALLGKGEKLFTDGEIVHNKNVISHLRNLGLKLEPVEDGIFVIRAHGLPPKIAQEIAKNHKILDLTCPIVLNVFKLAEKLNSQGFGIVVFGKSDHAEMIALKGHVQSAIITKEPLKVDLKKIALLSQTTSPTDDFYTFVKEMKELNSDVEISVYNTICNVTTERENAAKRLSKICDLVIVVGGKNSSNTRKLYDIASKGTLTLHAEDLKEFEEVLKSKVELESIISNENSTIGVLSGTSTSQSDVNALVKYILEKYGGRESFMSELNKNTAQVEQQENFEELLEQYEKATEASPVGRGRIVEGIVTEITPTGLTVDFGWKGTGVVPLEEMYKELSEYKVGDKIIVRIEKLNEDEGTALLSEKKPMARKVIENIDHAYSEGKTVYGKIIERTKGGYRVILENIVEAFLPGSESNIKEGEEVPREKMHFAIINFEQRGKKLNIVVSRKRIFQKLINEFFETRKQGDVIEGIVEQLDEKGAFVKIGGVVNGFLPNSEVSYNSSIKASDVLSIGKVMKFLVKEIDPARKRITLSLKALMPDPWESVDKKFKVGQSVTGVVTSVKPFGFFAKIDDGIEGLVPVSEVFWGKPGKVTDVVNVGDHVKLQILEIIPEKRRILLSYKSVEGDIWERLQQKHPEGSVAEGKVIKVLPNGVIIEIEPGLTAFCNISEISWNFVDKIEDVVAEGQHVKFQILSIDKENKKVRVSIRKATENPWEKFAAAHKEGDTVSAKIIKSVDKGYIGVCENVEVYIPKTQVYENLSIGEEVSGKIIKLEKQKDIYKIIVSPKAYGSETMKNMQNQEKTNFSNVTLEQTLEGKANNATESERTEETTGGEK
ncbi:MAG: bifunctional 4-hydroxy-3-methylbut-2-enyl diphosphate reductase/30S ribosomal protein S1 [Fervidobacterium sp.]|uniref:bifunctional 4-hydroxy-3-methylbut-2-enyl diphosphate reductase/30S ribosomal protein S1 n=1 Tax=Fervidobacterium sp. TaxID=1871331 RepID=UPI0030AF7DE1